MEDYHKKIIYKALAFTFAILFFALLLANVVYDWKQNDIDQSTIDLTDKVNSLKLSLAYFDLESADANSCGQMDQYLIYMADKVFDLGKVVNQFFEDNEKEQDAINLQRKFVYADLELWLRLEALNKQCGFKRNYILYFYPYSCKECGPLASSVMSLKDKYGESLWIFSVPGQIDIDFVDFLQKAYSVDYLPSVVVNGHTLKGPEAYRDIENYMYLPEVQSK